ncbi:disulfide bond reductase DsbH [Kordia sp. SMS9]|uniref:thioredoxin family protein n=1 Tax=Kordia sp. SMS9 TaxID=2282170 RepID=UPI000E0D8C17|nr:thioredoxin family protein [Kordia sp. SMS9]AXG69982.1 disulfide bond reductase DsbH [Kordia sp. SMS9]
MKFFTTLVFSVFLLCNLHAQKEGKHVKTDSHNLRWYLDYQKAKKVSTELEKPMLLFFTGSDWCGACIELEKNYFSKSAFIKLAEKFVLVELDFPRNEKILRKDYIDDYMMLRKKYNAKGFPTVILLDDLGNVIGRVSGYRGKNTKRIYTNLIKAALEAIL